MSDHRWQGYHHQELFDQIHQGPGAEGSTDSVHRWQQLTRALGDIDTDLASALTAAMAGWQGEAAENARGGLRPLGDWATQAQQAAQMMRERAEQQAEFVGKARNEMPAPVPVRSEDPGTATTLLTHLFGGQTDHEVQEARQDAAEQRAFQVMRTYESSTQANTTSLASFAPPPQVVVNTPPVVAGASGSGGHQPVTISFTPTPGPAPRSAPGSAARAAPGRGAASGSDRRQGGRSDRSTRVDGARDGGARSDGTRSGGTGRRADQHREDAHPVDDKVTEEIGSSGGFFDDHRTPSRPVIGGEAL